MDALKPGDVVLLPLPGAVQTKVRPVVVLSSELYHREHPDIIAGAVTTNITAAVTQSDHILQDWQSAGLLRPSAFRAYLGSQWQNDVLKHIGRLSDRDWNAVQECVRRALSL